MLNRASAWFSHRVSSLCSIGVCLLIVACGATNSASQEVNPPVTHPPLSATRAAPVPPPQPTDSPTPATAPLFFAPVTNTALLGWAHMLVSNVPPANTSYRHTHESVTWQGEHGATQYVSRTDCSGLVNALFAQTYGLTPDTLARWLGTTRPLAETYYRAITTQRGFRSELYGFRTSALQDIQHRDRVAGLVNPRVYSLFP